MSTPFFALRHNVKAKLQGKSAVKVMSKNSFSPFETRRHDTLLANAAEGQARSPFEMIITEALMNPFLSIVCL